MKRLFTTLGLSAVLAVGFAQAQQRTTMKADIPFEFRVGKAVLPAGSYTVVENLAPGVVALRGVDTDAAAVVLTNGKEQNRVPERGSLVFNRYGSIYFLKAIWKPGDSIGRELPESKAEREMARAGTRNELAAVRITLASVR